MKEFKSEFVPIVYSCGIDFVVPTYVSAFSLLSNSDKNRHYLIFILSPGNFTDDVVLLLKTLENTFNNCTIQIIDMGSKYSDIPIKLSHVKYPLFYRLSIPKILSSFDKCLYLDSDTIIIGDISKYFDIDISNFDIAGVLDKGFVGDEAIKHAKRLGIENLNTYINSGTLLMNLYEIRKHSICDSLEAGAYKLFPCVDQDVFNSLCYGKIKTIPIKYNAMTRYTYYGSRSIHLSYGRESILEAKKNPVVVHYIGGKVKPWCSKSALGAGLWWKQIKKIDKGVRNAYIDPFIKANKASFKLRTTIFISKIMIAIGLYHPIISLMKKNGSFNKIKKKL